MADLDMDHLRGWIGRTETRRDVVTAALVERLRATLPGQLWAGVAVPLGVQWCLALPAVPLADLGADGHPARGGFLPPVPLASRMWAGGELKHSGAFAVGDEVERVSQVKDVVAKEGRSGALVFVTVEHDYRVEEDTVLWERQDIVYREPVKPVPVTPASAPEPGSAYLVSDPVQLFRYSALTFNGHRIHYDADYVRGAEGYPGLVVHGPLQATLILNRIALALGRVPDRFSFRGLHPLIAGEAYRVVTGDGEGFCEKAGGTVTMKATFSA